MSEINQNKKLPEIPQNLKLQLFITTICMFVLPISTYYYILNHVFNGIATPDNTSWAGLGAALMANVVLAVYVIFAFLEPPSYPPLSNDTSNDTDTTEQDDLQKQLNNKELKKKK